MKKKLIPILAASQIINVPLLTIIMGSCSRQESKIVLYSKEQKNQYTTLSEKVIDINIETSLQNFNWNVSIDSSKDSNGQNEITFDEINKKIVAKKNSMGIIKIFASSPDNKINSNTLEFWFCDEFKFGLINIEYDPTPHATAMFNLRDNPNYDGPVVVMPTMLDAHSSAKPTNFVISDIFFDALDGHELHLKRIYLDDNLFHISNGAFHKCKNLEYIRWSSGVKTIEPSLFAGCENLVKVDNLEKIIEIKADAFRACSKLCQLSNMPLLESIGDDAFRLCLSLKKFNFGPQVNSINLTAFENCELEEITLDPNNANFTSFNGSNCLGLKNGHEVILGALKTKLDNPDIISIANNAFHGRGFVNLEIPNNIKSIGDYAFSECIELESVTITNNTCSIGTGVFSGCALLNKINWDVPQSIKKLPNEFFKSCKSITSYVVPNQIEVIGASAFEFSGLEDIVIHNNVSEIQDYAFATTLLKSISLPTSLTNISPYTFATCSNLTNVIVNSDITSIGKSAFAESKIETINVPNSCESIGSYCFSACKSLESIDLSKTKITQFEEEIFSECTQLKTVKLPTNTTKLGRQMFLKCNSLEEFDLSELSQLQTIPDYCFLDCFEIQTIKLPSQITSIGSGAFQNCTKLSNIEIPSSVTKIWDFAFNGCGYITSIKIPSSVQTILNSAFKDTNLETVDLSGFTTSESIPSVGTNVFSRILEGKIKFLVKDNDMLEAFKNSEKGWNNYVDEDKFTWEVKQ